MNCIKYERNVRKLKSLSKSKRFNDYVAKLDANAIENGVLPSEEEWKYECPNLETSEEIFFYGIDSNENLIVIRFKRRPTNDGKCLLKANLLYKEGDDIYEYEDTDVINKHHSHAYRLHGLRIQILSPFRKTRITFRGIVRKRSTNSKQWNEVFVKFYLIWYPLSKAFDFKHDNKASFIAIDVTLNDFDVSTAFEDRYEQYGQLKGTIQIESSASKNLFLWGNKCKKFCDHNSNVNKTWKRMFAFSTEGLAFHFGVCVDNEHKKGFRYGHCITGFLVPFSIVNTTLTLNDALKITHAKEFQITAKDERHLNVHLDANLIKLNNWCSFQKCCINKNRGGCIFVEEYSDEHLDKIIPPFFTKIVLLESKPAVDHLVVPIDKYYCSDVYGAKATSLSQLLFISQEIAENMEIPYFDIPKGIIVTTNAYHLFMFENVEIADVIDIFESKIWNKKCENIENACEVIIFKMMFNIGDESSQKAYNIAHFGHDVEDDDIRNYCSRGAQMETSTLKNFLANVGCSVKKSDGYCSNAKTAASIALVSTLLKTESELQLNAHLYHDISLLLTNNKEVISGDVSRLLREIAVLIENRAHFRTLNDQDAFKYLMHSEPMAKKALQKFLKKYGHRCYNEFDVYCEPWEQNATPITNETLKEIGKGEKVCGTPVCIGNVSGRAVVVKTFDDVDLIQRGDILITNSIDVAWSPYFSLINGIVTEINCLLSHGSTVIREYGLPCIVGANNATLIFKTGDQVLLDSQSGVLLKYKEN
ncbi:putative phosphoenolpyruvate synthase-like protein [Leptotrombidium deliense]|uniref:Putative phosphoenolpyruvate synthase-like protein n=1 Tax=Leptotrombidium deliense TaxID=299467 RepID=A0A443SSG2_9ACAR|nr:putative phosphoenolpyruvate synthase-like protein [Leptotrombidium deliense]